MAQTHFSPSGPEQASMAVSTDALVLADFVEAAPGERILDLGCGVGPIAMAIASREAVSVCGVDCQIEAIERAAAEWENLKGVMAGTCVFQPGDLRHEEFIRELGPFDHVVCNPPYYKIGEGRLPPNPGRAAARHEVSCTLDDTIAAARWALKPGGTLWMVHIPARLPEIIESLASGKFWLCALQPVYTRNHRDAELMLFRARSGSPNGAPRVMAPYQLRALSDGL